MLRATRHVRALLNLLPLSVLLCACDYFSPTESPPRCIASATPTIAFTSVPPIGSSDRVKGTAVFQNTPCDARDYRVALYVSFNGIGGICKPFQSSPLTEISDKGNWEASYNTGGVDEQAPWIFALLVTKEFMSPCFTESIPQVDGVTVLARVSQHRTG
jgi:hypothetical protein